MSKRTLKSYDFRQVDFIFDGFDIGGYAADGGIEIEWGADASDYEVGADGEVTVFENNDDTAILTVTLKETSTSYKDLFGIWKAQQLQTTKTGKALLLRDKVTGDELRDGAAYILSIPTPSKAKGPGDRVFRILAPYARASVKLGSLLS